MQARGDGKCGFRAGHRQRRPPAGTSPTRKKAVAASDIDDLDPARIRKRIEPLTIAHALHVFDSVDSTNEFLRALTGGEARHGTLALANHQTGGRGRHGRRWCDAPGRSLLFSLLLEGTRPVAHWPILSLGAAVAACRVLEREAIEQLGIRWPNDVLIEGRKVCGILAETASAADMLVLGVGLNVHQRAEDFPEDLRDAATSLQLAKPGRWVREDLLLAFLADFESVYGRWQEEEDGEILADCRRRLASIGRPVSLNSRGRRVEGVVVDLDGDGSLILRESTGVISRWHSGDI